MLKWRRAIKEKLFVISLHFLLSQTRVKHVHPGAVPRGGGGGGEGQFPPYDFLFWLVSLAVCHVHDDNTPTPL